ncbi:two-component regulator propeller domain-containing protein [Bacteroides sp.]|uniref:hybrid sensor histidine kinase/response regulator transcription factor n=1 Tax=Bacteroides sp. TaxID=29523 RepID=UPI002639510C|nr:two-component regulator propeller domain-containing protein [Bacteroides sp.]MDD3039184.1 two-component regulator propeller domain-containing protein [Bacteroides sp.]
MKKWLFLLLLCPIICMAQTYQYLGVEDGMSNRRVYCIQKDKIGYMWFLTHEGIDRYNGKEFKQYKLMDNGVELNSLLNINWLYIDTKGILWEIGKKGRIFYYDHIHDKFECVYRLPEEEYGNLPCPISYSWLDDNNNIWLCNENIIFIYNTLTQEVIQVENKLNEAITDIEQIDKTHFFIGTEMGLHHAKLENNTLELLPCDKLDNIGIQTNDLYFDPKIRKLFIGTFQRGIMVYDMESKMTIQPQYSLTDVSISKIKPFNNKEILIATDGGGVYKLNVDNYKTEPYIIADYNSNNNINGNSINDIYIDDEERIWMANYPIGITVRNNRFSSYKWIKHSIGNKQSIINDQVNAIIEDSDGDLWFGTNNGISLLDSETGKWSSFLSSYEAAQKSKNHIFTTLCEVSPGIIWAAGYSSGIYEINKKTLNTKFFTPSSYSHENIRPDKYMRDIYKDSEGYIWAGGYHNLKRINIHTKEICLYHGLNSITTITERNEKEMWIGSANGLYLLNKESGKFKCIQLPVESTYIYSLYQTKNGSLYIGTSGSGLLIYDPDKKLFSHYYTENCALISNNIYTILSDEDEDILLATENGLTSFYPKQKTFHNWTREMGLMTTHFNPLSGILRKNNKFILGSVDGAVEFSREMKIPRTYSSKMILSDFKLFYQTIYPGDKDSPLKADINLTKKLQLKYNQNIFSLMVSSINYDYPSNILYSWKLEGFYDEWSKPGTENIIRYTNLAPGEYKLRIRAVSNEDKRIVLGERQMDIVIDQPFWLTFWAILIYTIAIIGIATITLRILILRKQRKASDDKIQFFINTAHDIRTPLTLIKAPMEDVREKEQLSKEGVMNMNTALRNVNALLRLTTNLINFERADVYSSELYISEHELNTYMNDIFNAFQPYANIKHIKFTYESNFRYLNAWFDKEKMESILKNIISNALKYTPENGCVQIFVSENDEFWSVEVRDTGIGIPANEQKNLFRLHFRGSNAINSKITGSGIGLMLVWKLVKLHKGKINLSSVENQGSVIKVSFPKDSKRFRKAHLALSNKCQKETVNTNTPPVGIYESIQKKQNPDHQRILIVEDNDELRNYLLQTLSEDYTIQTCSNGKEALTIIPEYKPELVISDIMMPEMRGDELCNTIKNNIETSHIPIILLTALNNEKDILSGLRIGADEYIVKPFNIGILKATVANLLVNRALLRNKYGNLEMDEEEENNINCTKDIDWKFLANVRKHVENNIDNSGLTVDVLCNLVGMSRTSFYNKLRALTDQAPADFIKLIRLKRAAQLLKEGKYNVTEISEMVGFSDVKYFREVFKKRYNVSPSQYGKREDADKEGGVS